MADVIANSTDAKAEWISRAVPDGSGRYYALLHADDTDAQRQKLITALISIFSQIGFQSREIEVAKQKALWWQQELLKDKFQHPVMLALRDQDLTPAALHQLQHLLDAYTSLLTQGSPSGDTENFNFHLHTGSTACYLLANTEAQDEVLRNTGIALSKFRCYRYLRMHIERGLLCLPISTLEAANISPADLVPGQHNEKLETFFQRATDELLLEMQSCAKALGNNVAENSKPRSSKSVYVYLALQIALLQSIKKDGCRLLSSDTRLTPIRNYWHAFRAARKFEKSV